MKQFLALLGLELSQWKLSLSMSMSLSEGKKKKKDRAVTRTLGIIALVLFIAVYLVFIEIKVMDILIALGRPELLTKLLVTFSIVLTFVLGLFQVISSLYFSRDIAIIGYLPVRSSKVYAARLCGSLVQEIATSALFILPGTIIFFTKVGFDAGLLARSLLVTIVSPVLPTCLAALLAGLLTKVPGFWKHKEAVTTFFSILSIVAAFALSFGTSNLGTSADADPAALQNVINMIMEKFDGITMAIPPIRWFTAGIVEGGLNLVWGVLVSCGALALVCFLFGRNYISVATRSLENSGIGKKVDMKTERIRSGSSMSALIRREMWEMIRTPAYLTNGLLMSLIMPTLMVGVLLFSFSNNVEGGIAGIMAKGEMNGQTKILMAVVVTGLMSLLMGMNSTAATAVSREGHRHALMRSLPVSSRTIMMSKLWTAVIFQEIGILPAIVIIAVLVPNFLLYDAMILAWGAMLAFFGACLGLLIDVSKPKMDWINETQAIKSGFNQIISLLVYLAMLVIIGIGVYFTMSSEGLTMEIFAVLMTVFLAVICVVAWLLVRRSARAYEKIGE